jgi:hypothetical protein
MALARPEIAFVRRRAREGAVSEASRPRSLPREIERDRKRGSAAQSAALREARAARSAAPCIGTARDGGHEVVAGADEEA